MTPPAGPPLLALGADGRATVTLNRPQHLNRLHREDLLALQDHFARIAADPGVCVLVLTGGGRAFCPPAPTRGSSSTPSTRWKPWPCRPSHG